MPDGSLISGLATSAKIASDIVQATISLRDGHMIREKVTDLQSEIIAAQSAAIKANSEHTALVDQVRALEKEIASLKAWDAEKEKYDLHRRPSGALTYVPKKTVEPSEPHHELCASCYSHSIKSLLQAEVWAPGRCGVLCCHECGSVIYVSGHPHPDRKGDGPSLIAALDAATQDLDVAPMFIDRVLYAEWWAKEEAFQAKDPRYVPPQSYGPWRYKHSSLELRSRGAATTPPKKQRQPQSSRKKAPPEPS